MKRVDGPMLLWWKFTEVKEPLRSVLDWGQTFPLSTHCTESPCSYPGWSKPSPVSQEAILEHAQHYDICGGFF